MKIVIIEPLGITPEKLEEAVADVKARGHEIVSYDTKEEDQDKLAERGKDADIIVVDFMETHRIDPEHFASKAKFSPFADEEVRGKVLYTMVGGKLLT